MLLFPLEFSPVDVTAKAILKLAQHHDKGHPIYHAYHRKPFRFMAFVKAARAVGIKMKPVSASSFFHAVRESGGSPDKSHIREALIHDINADGKLGFQSRITLNNDFTTERLARCGFKWPETSVGYLTRYIEYFRNIGFLEV
jgi:hypothetical protein